MTKVASFDVLFHQYLNESGQPTKDLPEFCQEPDILCELYQTMVLARAYDTKAIALQRTGKMGTYAPIHGQEAISTAIGYTMQKEDVLIPYYRDYAAQVQRGVKMSEIYQYWGGDERGNCYQDQAEDLPISVPIASQCLHASGIAYAFKYRKEARVAVCCIGEGGTSEGDFYEAINVAGAWQLPVVFIVNNNQWAISVPREKQTACQTIAQKAFAAGIEGVQVDGNDVIACVELMQEKIKKARDGQGPTVIEALTYRLCDHTTADDATRYQPDMDVEKAKEKEPIKRFKTYLESINAWDSDKEETLKQDCQEKVNIAVKEYESQTPQPIESIFDYHYDTLPEHLEEQRAMALEEENNG